MSLITRYIGIDYSGAQTPTMGLKGLRVYLTEGYAPPVEVRPPPSPKKYWTRCGIAEWLAEDMSTLVGIDHGIWFVPLVAGPIVVAEPSPALAGVTCAFT
jgi:hypothetical protein